MNIKTLVCLSLLAVGCAAPTWADGGVAAAEEIAAPKPGEPHYTLRSYYFRSTPKIVVRTEDASGEVLYADPSLDIPVGAIVLLEGPDDAESGGATSILSGEKWLVLQGPVKSLGDGVYECMLDNLDHVDGAELAAYDGADMPESWRKVRDLIRQEMADVDLTAKLADNETGKITVCYEANGYVYKYNGVKYSSARKLAKLLDKAGTYRLFFDPLSSDKMMLKQVKAMEAAGISINSVECRNNRDASTEVISVRKLKERAK